MSHKQFESKCVKLDFARMPVDEEEQEREGHNVFHKGQLNNIVV